MKDVVQKKILDQLFENSLSSLLAVFLSSGIVSWIFLKLRPPNLILLWWGANLSVCLPRLGLYYFYKRRWERFPASSWRRLFYGSLILSGLVYGSGGLFIFPVFYLHYQLFFYFVLAGMVAGAVGLYAMLPPAFYCYSIPLFFPTTLRLLLMGGPIYTAMTGMGSLFFVMMMITAYRMGASFRENAALSVEKEELVTYLEKEKEKIEVLNEELLLINRKLQEQSLCDPLTGLRNRRYFFQFVEPEGSRFAREVVLRNAGEDHRAYPHADTVYGVYLIDIDLFKHVNDTFGHDAGDRIIRQIADIFKKLVRNQDIVARWGGEEFLIIARDIGFVHLDAFAEKLRRSVEEKRFYIKNGVWLTRTCSVGFVPFPLDGRFPDALSLEECIILADRALYHSKNNGRNCAHRFSLAHPEEIDQGYLKSLILSYEERKERGDFFMERIETSRYNAVHD